MQSEDFVQRSDNGLPPGFVRLARIAPTIFQDIRYASRSNFMGRPVPGYSTADCWLREEAARALARVAVEAACQDLALLVYDGYRPQKATDAFVRWAAAPDDLLEKPRYYPAIDKDRLIAEGFIGKKSVHSTGVAADLCLVRQDGGALDFGTTFDFFDPRSTTAHPGISDEARRNRSKLVELLAKEGFENYHREWWHFELSGFAGAPAYDVPIVPI
jgi:D-alanyl-D-alanine dipeptidase